MQAVAVENRRIGEFLIHDRIITEDQLEHAIVMQTGSTSYKPLGQVLVDLGYISRHALRQALIRYRKQIPLGEVLFKLGIITKEQLDEALDMQKKTKKRLGLLLLERGFVKRSSLADAICMQLGIECSNMKESQVDRSLLDRVNAAFLMKRRVLPLKYDSKTNTLTLLMEDPTDQEAITDLEKIFRAAIEPVMLRDGWIEAVLTDAIDVWS
jgi:hypothetical protein